MSSSFFFNDTATTEIYTLSLHDALPILSQQEHFAGRIIEDYDVFLEERGPDGSAVREIFIGMFRHADEIGGDGFDVLRIQDRKSTRLNSSHQIISYAVFCLKKKKE